jgi:hypothetical protein
VKPLNSEVPATPTPPQRWLWTRRLARLGTVGAVVLGAGIALDVGGGGWNNVLVAWLFGLPFSFPLAWAEALYPSAQGAPAAAWGMVHLALGASTIASWTAMGVAIDLIRARVRHEPPRNPLDSVPEDAYLEAARVDVEEMLRGRSATPVKEPRAGAVEFIRLRRLLSNPTI